MKGKEKQLVNSIDHLLPWHDKNEMPIAKDFILADTDNYGMHADYAINLCLGWSAVTRWVYRQEIIEVMKRQGIWNNYSNSYPS